MPMGKSRRIPFRAMASKPEVRGTAVRTTWLLGGNGPKQSVTFSGGDPKERMAMAVAAKALAEAKNHCVTRDEVYAALAARDDPEPSKVPTLKQWLPMWRALHEEAGDVQAHTLLCNERTLVAHALPFLGHLRLDAIDRKALKGWVAQLKKQRATYGKVSRRDRREVRHLSGSTVRNYYQTLSACLAGAVPVWLPANPAVAPLGEPKNYLGLPPESGFDGMFLEPWECDLILQHCAPELRGVVFVALRTGLRVGELAALEVRHVVFSRSGGATVRVQQTVKHDGTIGEPKTVTSRRDVTVTGKTAELLLGLVRGRRLSARVFLTARGKPWHIGSLRESHWHRAVGAAMRCPDHLPPAPERSRTGRVRQYRPDEVSVCDCEGVLRRRPRIHDLRHTHASALLESGMSPKKVQLRLGHSSYQVTMRIYAHVQDNGRRDELDALERFLTEAEASFVLAG